MMSDADLGGPAPEERVLRVGTWNMSHWSAAKVAVVASTISVDVLAVQETHLAPVPLEVAHTTVRQAGLHLHHGRPVAPLRHSEHGRSCGVGFLCRSGIPVLPAPPCCPAWRRLVALRRLHGIRLAPRPGLPHGILLLSIYAPLREQGDVRACFDEALMEVMHALHMRLPTLLMGDFNGSVCPSRDFQGQSGARRPVCPLLAHLLGPGSPWVDAHESLLAPLLAMTFRNSHSSGKTMASRIDLILANSSCLRLLRSASVQEEVRDGGHCPVLVTLDVVPGTIRWQRPRPRPPAWLGQSS